jgi:hypothetical protein
MKALRMSVWLVVSGVLRQYQDTLAQWVESQTGRQPAAPEEPAPTHPYRGRDITPTVPVIEIE